MCTKKTSINKIKITLPINSKSNLSISEYSPFPSEFSTTLSN